MEIINIVQKINYRKGYTPHLNISLIQHINQQMNSQIYCPKCKTQVPGSVLKKMMTGGIEKKNKLSSDYQNTPQQQKQDKCSKCGFRLSLIQYQNLKHYRKHVYNVQICLPERKPSQKQKVTGQQNILQHLDRYIGIALKGQQYKISKIKNSKINITIASKTFFIQQLQGKRYKDIAEDAELKNNQISYTNYISISINTNQQVSRIKVNKETTINCELNQVSDDNLTIKANVNIGSQKISIKQYLNTDKCDELLNKISQIDPTGRTSMLIYNQIINRDINKQEKKNHQKIKQRMVNEVNKKQNKASTTSSPQLIMLCLQSQLKSQSKQAEVIFSQKPSLESKITMRLLSLGYALNKKKCRQTIVETKQNESIIMAINKMLQQTGQNNFSNFQFNYKDRISYKYGIRTQNIHILRVSRNPLAVDFQILKPLRQAEGLQQQPEQIADQNIMPHPYFQKFHLSKTDFDSKGDIQFFEQKSSVQYRGNWPYYQPIKCKRFGLNVSNKFDNGDNKWLQMKNTEGEWVSVFHGMRNPQKKNFNHSYDNDFQNIFAGLKQGTAIKPGRNNVYASSQSVNFNQVIGNGIYCTPHIKDAIGYANSISISQNNPSQKYCLVFQCRVNPKTIHITPNQSYWVIKKESDMRPYGIILMKQSVKQKYPRPEQQFKEKFSYKKYKQRIDKTQRS